MLISFIIETYLLSCSRTIKKPRLEMTSLTHVFLDELMYAK